MIILTSYTAATYKAQIRSSVEKGFKVLYTATCTSGEEQAAKSVVAKWFSKAAADSVCELKDQSEINAAVGTFFQDPKRKQIFSVWSFNAAAKDVPAKKGAAGPPASQAKLALQGESTGPDWTRARFLLGRIKTAIRLSLAGQVLLGMELLTIKTELGFVGRKRRGGALEPHDAVLKSLNKTWEQWCNAELNGLSNDTADRFIGCYETAKLRVKNHGGDKKLLGLLETHPAKLTEEDDKLLAGMVDKLVDGDTQKSLLEELKLVKCHVALTGGDTSKHQKKKPANAEQLVFAMFAPVEETITKATRAVENLRIASDYQRLLYALPLVSSEPGKPSLTALEAQLQAALEGDIAKALEEVRAVKAVRMNNPAAKASA